MSPRPLQLQTFPRKAANTSTIPIPLLPFDKCHNNLDQSEQCIQAPVWPCNAEFVLLQQCVTLKFLGTSCFHRVSMCVLYSLPCGAKLNGNINSMRPNDSNKRECEVGLYNYMQAVYNVWPVTEQWAMEWYHVGVLHEVHNEWLDILCPFVDVAVVGNLAVGEHQHRSTCFKHILAFRNRQLFKFTHLLAAVHAQWQTEMPKRTEMKLKELAFPG